MIMGLTLRANIASVETARFKTITLTPNIDSNDVYDGEEVTCVKKLQNKVELLESSRYEYVVVDTRGHIIIGKQKEIVKKRIISETELKRISGSITEATIQGIHDYVEAVDIRLRDVENELMP